LNDAQALDLARDTELKTEQARITALQSASTSQADIDEYGFQLFMIQGEIDEIKERMESMASLITEEQGQYATRLEE
jgi:hypothetical protein